MEIIIILVALGLLLGTHEIDLLFTLTFAVVLSLFFIKLNMEIPITWILLGYLSGLIFTQQITMKQAANELRKNYNP
jgi:hypothetical protein